MNRKNPDLELMRRIHPEVWILWIDDPFLDLPPPPPKKKATSVFGFGNQDLDFPPKKHSVSLIGVKYFEL